MKNELIGLSHAKEQVDATCCMTCHFADFSCGLCYGECHRHAPVPRTYSSDDLPKDEDGDCEFPSQHDVVDWPLTHFRSWCGEYEDAEPERVEKIIDHIKEVEDMNAKVANMVVNIEISKQEEENK